MRHHSNIPCIKTCTAYNTIISGHTEAIQLGDVISLILQHVQSCHLPIFFTAKFECFKDYNIDPQKVYSNVCKSKIVVYKRI